MNLFEAPRLADRFGPRREADRHLEISFPRPKSGSPMPGGVLAQRAHLVEAISEPWHLTVHVLAEGTWFYQEKGKTIHEGTQPHPEQFLGQHARVVIRADDLSRTFDGIVTAVRQLGRWPLDQYHQDLFELIELEIEPTLALLAYRKTSQVFHEIAPIEAVFDVIRETIGDNFAFGYGHRLPQQHIDDRDARRAYVTQYKETDLAFLHRMLAEAGLSYLLPNDPDAPFGHYLSFFVPEYRFPKPEIVLGRSGMVPGYPLSRWHARRRLTIPRTRLSSHDYKGPAADADAKGRDLLRFLDAGGSYGDYLPLRPNARPRPGKFSHTNEGEALQREAVVRQWAYDQQGELYEGETTVPLPLGAAVRVQNMACTRQSRLGQTERERRQESDGDYIVTRQQLTVRAALHPDLRAALDRAAPDERVHAASLLPDADDEPGALLLSAFEALPMGLPIAPDPARLERPTPHALTATVIGPENETVHTDKLGRIAVTMHWQRKHDLQSEPQRDHFKRGEPTVWLRYVQPGAGNGIGFQYLPRVGDEVLVVFLDGDPDRPIAVGSVHNGHAHPPRFGGQRHLPHNRALTGLRTAEHGGGGGSNELCLDDSKAEVGLRLASSTAATALTLGHIATARAEGKAALRGIGAELRTGGAMALRGTQGILISTFDAPSDAPHAAHPALRAMVEESAALLRKASERMTSAQLTAIATEPADGAGKALATWRLQEKAWVPAVAVAAKGPLILASETSQLIHAGTTADIAATNDIQLVAGQSLRQAAFQGISLHTEHGGLHAYAVAGDVTLTAATGHLRQTAKGDMELKAGGTLRLHADRIELVSRDGSSITLDDAIEMRTEGTHTVRCALSHLRRKAAVPLDPLPDRDAASDDLSALYLNDLHCMVGRCGLESMNQ